MANSTIKRISGIVYSKEIDIANTEITNLDSGWYYKVVNTYLPANTTAIGLKIKNFDGDVVISLSNSNNLILQSPHSKTLPESRSVIVLYVYN